jgi:chromate transporter
MDAIPQRISLHRIFRAFFSIGAFSFGGGLLGWIHRDTVVIRRWLDDEHFLPGVVLSRVLPGSNVANLAIYIGHRLRGLPGACVALLAVIAGPFFLCLALAHVYDRFAGSTLFHAALAGASAGAIGMGLRVGYSGTKRTCRTIASTGVAGLIVVLVGVLRWPMPPVVLVLAPVSIWLNWRGSGDHAD